MSCKYQKISSNEVGSVINCVGCDELIIGIETNKKKKPPPKP